MGGTNLYKHSISSYACQLCHTGVSLAHPVIIQRGVLKFGFTELIGSY